MKLLIAVTLFTCFTFGATTVADSAVGNRPTDTITPSQSSAAHDLHAENPTLPKASAVLSVKPAKPDHVAHVGEPVRDEYLVFLEDGDRREVPAVAAALAHAHSGRLIRVWSDGVQGFRISMNAAQAEAMLHDPHVRAIEENATLHDSGTQTVGGSDPFWHLDRIDQRSSSLDGTFQYCSGANPVYAYIFDHGVRAADSQLSGRVQPGKNVTPPDSIGTNTAATDPPPYPDGGSFDERNPCGEHNPLDAGHGTSVATLLAGSGVGVSKTTIVVPLRLANCQEVSNPDPTNPSPDLPTSGAWIDAFNWLFGTSNGLWDYTNERSLVRAVANFSNFIDLGARPATMPEFEVERLLRKLIRGGVVVVASANNQFSDGRSLTMIPARLSYSNPNAQSVFSGPERVITVGGTMRTGGLDKRWICGTGDWTTGDSACRSTNGSNFGVGIDIWAPADNVQSGHNAQLPPVSGDDPWTGVQHRRPLTFGPADGGLSASFRMYARSGTSFSAPIVAGAAARLLSEDGSLFNVPSATAAAVWNRLSASATRLDPIAANLGAGSPNLFIYIGGVNFKTQPQSVTMTGSSATLSAEAVGTGLTYQLYEGESGNTFIPVGAAQSSGTFTVSPTSTKTYWMRATNTCPADSTTVTGDSAEATIVVLPVVTASATNSSTVSVTWTAVGPSGTAYDLFRASAGSAFNFSTPIFSGSDITQFSDTGRATNQTYVYKVRATNGTLVAMSLPDYATTKTFTDADLTISPVINKMHIQELRSAVNLIADAMNIAHPYTQTELNAPSSGQGVAATDFTDVMARLNAVRANAAYQQLPPLSFRTTPAKDGAILKTQLVDLRNAVN